MNRTRALMLIAGKIPIGPEDRAWAARQLEARKKSKATRRERSAPRRDDKAQERRAARNRRGEVYAAVDERSGGRCEMEWSGNGARCPLRAVEHDHFWGRAREESVESVWHLCFIHHQNKTHNRPNRTTWLEEFRLHCRRHGYDEQVAKVDRALALERAQHPGARAGRGGPDAP